MSNLKNIMGGVLLAAGIFYFFVSSGQNKILPVVEKNTAGTLNGALPAARVSQVLVKKETSSIIEKISLQSRRMGPFDKVADPFKRFDSRDLIDRNALEFSELRLIGIVLDEDVSAALINEDILYAGEEISGFKVVEIRSNEVVLTRGFEKYTLRLFE